MSTPFFVVGAVIFIIYVGVLGLVILTQHDKQRKNPSELDIRKTDNLDSDGMGDYSRFGPDKAR